VPGLSRMHGLQRRTLPKAGARRAVRPRLDSSGVSAHPCQLPIERKEETAFEELTSRHAVMWGSAQFENIADIISDMHAALVERLVPGHGELWLDLACGAGDVAFHAARASAVVTGSDLSPTLVEAAERRAEEHGPT